MSKKLYTGTEIIGMFSITRKTLRTMRNEGLPCIMLDGEYYYEYMDVVEFLS